MHGGHGIQRLDADVAQPAGAGWLPRRDGGGAGAGDRSAQAGVGGGRRGLRRGRGRLHAGKAAGTVSRGAGDRRSAIDAHSCSTRCEASS
jgi:hypothetical protein